MTAIMTKDDWIRALRSACRYREARRVGVATDRLRFDFGVTYHEQLALVREEMPDFEAADFDDLMAEAEDREAGR